jgi:anti-sigma factor ChrR (cupin superfamily)
MSAALDACCEQAPAARSAARWPDLPFVPFRAGIEIDRTYGDRIAGPAATVLRYRTGASAPGTTIAVFEHVVMPAGSQEDERGVYPAGRLAINPPGSCRSVRSERAASRC